MPGFEKFSDLERQEVQEVLQTGVLMRYGFDGMRDGIFKARDLEQTIAKKFEINYAQLVSSGTTAVSLAMALAGVGSGDEVIMPTFTFVASFEAIIMLGATPVLVDIDNTLTLCPEAVEKAITPKTKAIMPVHMCGSMANLDALKDICKKYDLKLIEDACQAIGGTYNNKYLGTIGDIGCFSFDFVKTVTAGEGGAIITNHKDYAINADLFQDHGHDHIGTDRGAENHPYLGYNFRISELNAAVGLAQFRRLDEFLNLQKEYYSIIREELTGIDGLEFRHVPDGGIESGAFLNFFLPSLDIARKVSSDFKKEGIDVCFHYYDNNWHYVRKWDHLKNARSLYPLSDSVKLGLANISKQDFSQSNHYIGRNISCLIKIGWTKEEVKSRAQKMRQIITKYLM